MPKIPNRFEFKPSPETLEKWSSTRKSPYKIGKTELPGYFQTSGYSTDSVWVALVGGIELLAILTTLMGGLSKGGIWLLISIIGALGFVVLDYFGARLHHIKKGFKRKTINNMRVAEDSGVREGLAYELKKTEILPMSGVFFILFCAFLKVAAVFLLVAVGLHLTVIFTLLYVVAIYIHLKHTGYWLAERTVIKLIKKNHKEWAKNKIIESNVAKNQDRETNDNNIKKADWIFETSEELSLQNNTNGSEKIHFISFIKEKNGNGQAKKYEYGIYTNGILIDEDITELAKGQTTEMKEVIALACLNTQLQLTSNNN
jgi:hypothetical protein